MMPVCGSFVGYIVPSSRWSVAHCKLCELIVNLRDLHWRAIWISKFTFVICTWMFMVQYHYIMIRKVAKLTGRISRSLVGIQRMLDSARGVPELISDECKWLQ